MRENRFSKEKVGVSDKAGVAGEESRDWGVNRRRRAVGGGDWAPEQPRWVSELQNSFISLSVRFELVSFFILFLKLKKKGTELRKSLYSMK